jgi:hypothetical protein
MRTWSIQVHSRDEVRPHPLDERVLTSLCAALDAEPAAFDADVVGDGNRVNARFDLVASDERTAIAQARGIFLAALARVDERHRAHRDVAVEAREHVHS